MKSTSDIFAENSYFRQKLNYFCFITLHEESKYTFIMSKLGTNFVLLTSVKVY